MDIQKLEYKCFIKNIDDEECKCESIEFSYNNLKR